MARGRAYGLGGTGARVKPSRGQTGGYKSLDSAGNLNFSKMLPPVNNLALHMSVGVRAEFLEISPIFKFWPPAALLRLQAQYDAGNRVARHLSDT